MSSSIEKQCLQCPLRLKQRLLIDGQPCTVRYIGAIAAWPNDLAVGVEWDDPARGKNDGSVISKDNNGKQGTKLRYFITFQNQNSGSFFKFKKIAANMPMQAEDQKSQQQQSQLFVNALVAKYTDLSVLDTDIDFKFGSKAVQSVGFDNWMKLNSNILNLRVASLDRERIVDSYPIIGDVNEDIVNYSSANNYDLETCIRLVINSTTDNNSSSSNKFHNREVVNLPKLTSLDLSYNLFDCTFQTFKILLQTPNLQVLNLSHNYFVKDDEFLNSIIINNLLGNFSHFTHFASLKTLILSYNKLQRSTLVLLCLFFSELEQVDFSKNFIDDEWFLTNYVSYFEAEHELDTETIFLNNQQRFANSLHIEKISIGDGQKLKYQITIDFMKFLTINKNVKNWKTLNLSYNKFHKFPWALAEIFEHSQLSELKLSHNSITFADANIPYYTYTPTSKTITNNINNDNKSSKNIQANLIKYNDLDLKWAWLGLKQLDLSGNEIKSYCELDLVNLKFPNLQGIQISKIKLFEMKQIQFLAKRNQQQQPERTKKQEQYDDKELQNCDGDVEKLLTEEFFFETIFRFNDTLVSLNKSHIAPEERTNSELYFTSRFKEQVNSIIDSGATNAVFSDGNAFQFSKFGRDRLVYLCTKYSIQETLQAYNEASNNVNNKSAVKNGGSGLISGTQEMIRQKQRQKKDNLASNLILLKIRLHQNALPLSPLTSQSRSANRNAKAQQANSAIGRYSTGAATAAVDAEATADANTNVGEAASISASTTVITTKQHVFLQSTLILKFKGIIKEIFGVYSVLQLRLYYTLSFDADNGASDNSNNVGAIFKTEEISSISNEDQLSKFGFVDGDVIDVYFVEDY